MTMRSTSTEVRVTAETIMSQLHTEAHDQAHERIAEATRPRRSTTMRPALNGLEVKFASLTGTGILVTFVDGTRGYFSRSEAAGML